MASEITLLCQSCNRPTRHDIVYVTMWLGAQLNVVEGVPAHVCDDCGVQYYDRETEDKLRALTAAGFPAYLSVNIMPAQVFTLDSIESLSTPAQPAVARG